MPAFPPECWWEVRACVYFIHCVWLRGVSRSGVAAQTWADALCKKQVVWNQASLIGNESLYHGRSRRHIPDIISDFAVATSSHQPTDQPAAIAPSCPMKQTQWAANTIGIKQNTLTTIFTCVFSPWYYDNKVVLNRTQTDTGRTHEILLQSQTTVRSLFHLKAGRVCSDFEFDLIFDFDFDVWS